MRIDASALEIVIYPAAVLRQAASAVPQMTDEVRAVAQRMLVLMHQAQGVGLAGPQVDLSWRMFVANPTREPGDDRVFINPKLSQPSRQMDEYEEGCLSLPQITAPIRRPRQITIEAIDLDGQPFTLTSDDMAARVWQHEHDHLEGILILDRMAQIDRLANRAALRDLEQAAVR